MIYDEKMLAIDDQIDQVLGAIQEAAIFRQYLAKKQILNEDEAAVAAKRIFGEKKRRYEELQAYGKYAPGYQDSLKSVMQAKRELDLTPSVSEFRVAETNLQGLLDEIGGAIAGAIDEEIKVAAGNPFFETGSSASSCGGNCHGS